MFGSGPQVVPTLPGWGPYGFNLTSELTINVPREDRGPAISMQPAHRTACLLLQAIQIQIWGSDAQAAANHREHQLIDSTQLYLVTVKLQRNWNLRFYLLADFTDGFKPVMASMTLW